MEMNGGGTFGLFPGQFTDDSELASHLLKGLNHLNPKKSLKE
jgi:ADP-ribosylglycohydrolase